MKRFDPMKVIARAIKDDTSSMPPEERVVVALGIAGYVIVQKGSV